MNSIDTGRFIRIQRKKLNLSQSKLAEMLCVEPQTVSKWERGLGMPDYDNVDKLREIFNCTLSEILEPNFDEPEEAKTEEFTEEKETITNLPVLVEMIDSSEGSTTDGKKFSIFDFLNKKKLKEIIEKVFGYEYANTYNEKFLFKDVRKKRSKEEYENTITQGMFKNKTSHSVIGIEAPWLYLRVLFFMLMCTGIAAVASLFGITMPFVIIGSLCSVLPLMIFLFESNFARNLSIIDVLKMFAIGGLGSICLVAITSIMYEAIDETIVTVVFAPLLEEICKAFMVIYLVSKIKPTNMITGLLIGFSVGAGFSFFENVQYGTSSYLLGLVEYGDGAVASMATIAYRTIVDFLMGHHYWTGIFGAVYVLFKKDTKYDTNDLFQWKVMAALAFSIALHMMWNGSYMMDLLIIPSIIRILVCALSVGALIILIDIGITQTRLFGIWRDYQSERKEEML